VSVLEAEFRAQQDQIRIEVLDACSAIRRAGEALEQAAGAAEVAARVAEGSGSALRRVWVRC